MKLQSDFVLLDVKHGRKQLDKIIEKGGKGHDLPERIPVVIHGYITGRSGYDDGISQEFTVEVTKVETS